MRIFQFFKFSIVGALGFCVDVFCFYVLILIVNTYASRSLSFFAAVVFTYILNKTITFDNKETKKKFWKEFPVYFGSMLLGGAVNLTTFFFLESSFVFFSERCYIAIAIGSIAGLFVNFFLSVLIFRKRK